MEAIINILAAYSVSMTLDVNIAYNRLEVRFRKGSIGGMYFIRLDEPSMIPIEDRILTLLRRFIREYGEQFDE